MTPRTGNESAKSCFWRKYIYTLSFPETKFFFVVFSYDF